MCGEYLVRVLPTMVLTGSPPHVWRILNDMQVEKEELRITSTCVENTVNKSLYSAK